MATDRKLLPRLKRHGEYDYKQLIRELDEMAEYLEKVLAKVEDLEIRVASLESL